MAKIKKIFLIGLILRLFLIFVSSYHPDLVNHLDWGIRFWQYGPKNFYESIFWGMSWPNQPLGSIVLFALVAKLRDLIFALLWWLNLKIPLFPSFVMPFLEAKLHVVLVKLPFVLADIGLAWLIYQFVRSFLKKEGPALLGSLFFLFNPALIYNSAIWGQTDSLINFLTLFAFWGIYKKNYFWGIGAFLLSFYFKLSLIIWLPIFFLFVYSQKSLKKILFPLGFWLLFFIFVSLPFVHHGDVFSWLWYLYTNRILPRQGNMLSGNAFNLWSLIYGFDLSLKESMVILRMKAKSLGFILTLFFMLVSFCFFGKKKRKEIYDYFWLMFFNGFAAFLFLTNMHERYLYPIFVPLIILVVAGKVKKAWLVVFSSIHFLNLYHLWYYPKIWLLSSLLDFGRHLLPRFLSFLLIVFFVRLLLAYNNNSLNEKKETSGK